MESAEKRSWRQHIGAWLIRAFDLDRLLAPLLDEQERRRLLASVSRYRTQEPQERTQAQMWLDRQAEQPTRSEGDTPVKGSTPRLEQPQEQEEEPTVKVLHPKARLLNTAEMQIVQPAHGQHLASARDLARLTAIKRQQKGARP